MDDRLGGGFRTQDTEEPNVDTGDGNAAIVRNMRCTKVRSTTKVKDSGMSGAKTKAPRYSSFDSTRHNSCG